MEKERSNIDIYLLLLVMALLNTDQMVISPNMGMVERDLHITDKEIGYIFGGFIIIGAITTLVWGFLADKYNRKRLFVGSMLLGQIPCFFSAFVTNYTQFLCLRALTGFTIGAIYPIIFSYSSDVFPEQERGKINAWFATSVSLGVILGMFTGFLGQKWGWRLPFLLISISNIFFILLFAVVAKEPKRGAAEAALGSLIEKGHVYQAQVGISDYLNLFKIKTNLVLLLQGILGTIPWGAIPFYLIEFLKRYREMGQGKATMVFISFAIGNVIGIFTAGIVGGMLYRKKIAWMPLFCSITTFVGALFVLFILNYHPSFQKGQLFIFCFLGMMAAATVSVNGPNIKTMLMNVNTPESRARMFSIFNLTDSLGIAFGQFLGGVLSSAFGSLACALNISACCWIPCSVILFLAVFTLPNDVLSLHQNMQEKADKMCQYL